jgi:hypothetical protein
MHLLFRHAEGLRCSTSRVAPGVDVKADGGYAIYWPREGFAVEDRPLCEWPDWLLREAMEACGGHRQKGDPTTVFFEPASPELREAFLRLDPAAWRNTDASSGSYLRWFHLLCACKAAGITRDDFVEWSTRDPEYAGDGGVIGRKWDGAIARHPGALMAALKEAGIEVRRAGSQKRGEGSHFRPTVSVRKRTDRTCAILAAAVGFMRKEECWNSACVMAEMVGEGALSRCVADDLLRSALWVNGLWREDRGLCERVIAKAYQHVTEKLKVVT